MPRYTVHYTADVWEKVVVEASSEEEAKTLFETHDDKYFEALESDEPEQMGMENIKVDKVEEIK